MSRTTVASVVRRTSRLALDALLLELATYRSLARWVARRPDVPPGARAIGYSSLVTPMLWLWIFGSAVEVVAVELVLRHVGWDAARLPLLVLGVWGVLWMLGMMASNRVRPHLLTEERLRVRSGPRTCLDVPLAAVGAVRPVEHELPGVVRTVHVEGDLLLVGVGSRTNLELQLAAPTTLRLPRGEATVTRVGLWVDEPREVAGWLRPRRSAPSR